MEWYSLNAREQQLCELLVSSSKWLKTEIILKLCLQHSIQGSGVTIKRALSKLRSMGFVQRRGQAKATVYRVHPAYTLINPIDEEAYLSVEPDSRQGRDKFCFEIFELLAALPIFSPTEQSHLLAWQKNYQQQKAKLSPVMLRKEYERLTIELSWKSSAIEGNTYSLLDTETLLKEGIPATGKKAEEAQMLLNHKIALEHIVAEPSYYKSLSVSKIERIHKLVVRDMGVSYNLREGLVGITGTVYRPLDNVFQIRESLEDLCQLINTKDNAFEKAFLALVLISYIQPFEDGNKRTSRIVANAILLAHEAFPFSYRSIDIGDYKKAILLFYELNYLPAIKQLFLEQAQFAAENYFLSRT